MGSIFNVKDIYSFTVFYKNDEPEGFGLSFEMDSQAIYKLMLDYININLIGVNPKNIKRSLDKLSKQHHEIPEGVVVNRTNASETPKFVPIGMTGINVKDPSRRKFELSNDKFIPLIAMCVYLWAINEIPNNEFNGMLIMTLKDGVHHMSDEKLFLFKY
jgi:hypothetical protein